VAVQLSRNQGFPESVPLSSLEATIAQLVIAWTFSQPGLACALCGARNRRQPLDNAAAGDIALVRHELEAIGDSVLSEAFALA
jgi:methylglyoxal reductase